MINSSDRNDIEPVHCYAKRRVNPFRGVMQIIECEQGRALSCNGIVWEVQVTASHDNTFVSGEINKKTYYRFGMWSLDYGLMKRSDSPVDGQDYFDLSSKCDVLVSYLQKNHDQLPFLLEDDDELWLFDSDNKPLALLSSALPGIRNSSPEPDQWTACKGLRGNASQRRFPRAEELEAQVSQRARADSGKPVNKVWVRRLADGQGITEASGDIISADQLPVLLLEEDWQEENERQCVQEYIRWISPSLLTLQHLNRATRERIENNLNVQAISIEHHWHLYPEVIDEKLLRAARVQSRIEGCR